MKENINKKSIQTILPILALAVLLLFSPCKVRNFIQAKLSIPLTEVTNKSKSNLVDSNCSDLEFADGILTKETTSFQHDLIISTPVDFSFNSAHYFKKPLQLTRSLDHYASAVPLYILYQNFQDYI